MKKVLGILLGTLMLITGQLAAGSAASAAGGTGNGGLNAAAVQNCTQVGWEFAFVYVNRCMAPGQYITTGWFGNTAPQTKLDVVFQTDGNLVLYRNIQGQSGRTALWHTGTMGRNPWRAIMQSDGNFVLYDRNQNAYWHTDTWRCPNIGIENTGFEVQKDTNVVLYQRAPNGSVSVPRWDRLGYAPRC